MADTREPLRSGAPIAVARITKMNMELLLSLLFTKAKTVLRITTDVFDEEIMDILQAGIADLTTRGVIVQPDEQNNLSPLIVRALMTYVRYHFGEPEHPEKLKASYDEQRGQLMSTTGFTVWGDE